MKVERTIRFFLIFSMLGVEFALYGWLVAIGKWDWGNSLPIELCGVSMYSSCYMLFTKNRKVYNIIYFWGLLGGVVSILTPDIPYGFPHFKYLQFFTTHGGIILSVMFMTFVHGYRPEFKSVFKAVFYLLLYCIPVYILDVLTNANYLFLRHKPPGETLANILGPEPWYVFVIGALLIPYFLLLYLPIYLSKRRTERKSTSSIPV